VTTKKKLHEALDHMMDRGNFKDVESGFEVGQIHSNCEEIQQIWKQMEDLNKRILDHLSHCDKKVKPQ
jgi:hypothetical protein